MIDQSLLNNLNKNARDFAVRWKNLVRKAPQLRHYNALDDETLIEGNIPFYPLLAKTLDRGVDRASFGNAFVNIGKDRLKAGYPLSEIIYNLNLMEKGLIEYITLEYAPENPVRMYQSMGVLSQISEFFFLGCFYLTKGYLESIYTTMNNQDSISEELLKKYFRDDFFFKEAQPGAGIDGSA